MATIEGTSGPDRISTRTTVPGQPFATNLDDVLNGYGSEDLLDGAGGADVMTGGAGSDRYHVENVGDVVVEAANEGADRVLTTLLSYTLGDDVEELKFIGSGNFAGTGNELNNLLYSGTGNDRLNGGSGGDTFVFDAPIARSRTSTASWTSLPASTRSRSTRKSTLPD